MDKDKHFLYFSQISLIYAPAYSPEKPLYIRDLTNIYLLTFNNNKQTKQREDND